MSSELISYRRVERSGGPCAEIELNRPDKANALTKPMIERLGEIIAAIELDRDVRAVLVRGRGRFFCAGGDIEAWGALSAQEMARDWIVPGIRVLESLAALPVPVIAVLSGHTLGGGLELALAADLRIAHASAKIGAPEVGLGIISGWGGIRRLAETIGPARARHMLLLGQPVTAQQALDWGLVTAVAEDEAAMERDLAEWLTRLCANAPIAMALTKDVLSTMHDYMPHHHASASAQAIDTEDCREGVRAFVEKRKPVYRNR